MMSKLESVETSKQQREAAVVSAVPRKCVLLHLAPKSRQIQDARSLVYYGMIPHSGGKV